MNLEKITLSAVHAAHQAAQFIKQESKHFDQSKVEHKGLHDLVSYVDKNAEQILVELLQKSMPDCGFITEESTVLQSNREFNWIVDPLDGTTNFIHGLPCFCVSLGLMHQNELIAGVVHEINFNESFYAWKGGGAWLNQKPIQVSRNSQLSQSLLATGFPYTNYSRMDEYMKVFDYCMRNTRGLRRLGSAAADLAYVACGRLDGFFEYGLKAWDVAGGALLVKEAGGVVADFSSENNYVFGEEIVACNAGIFNEFMEVVKSSFKNS
jgi:myo-inositol-1(or 4)-monophosphatase